MANISFQEQIVDVLSAAKGAEADKLRAAMIVSEAVRDAIDNIGSVKLFVLDQSSWDPAPDQDSDVRKNERQRLEIVDNSPELKNAHSQIEALLGKATADALDSVAKINIKLRYEVKEDPSVAAKIFRDRENFVHGRTGR